MSLCGCGDVSGALSTSVELEFMRSQSAHSVGHYDASSIKQACEVRVKVYV